MDQDRVKDWRELCKAAANEVDPKKLMALIGEITSSVSRVSSWFIVRDTHMGPAVERQDI